MGAFTSGIVTLLTDFGTKDWYVGAVKGVLLSRCPSCCLVDITHEVPPGQIFTAAYVLAEAYGYFPLRSVHLAVVDPGVGGSRRPVVVEAGGHWFVGPDNGLFGPILEREKGGVVRAIEKEDLFLHPVSATFHGRDLFAPVAAHIACGGDTRGLGPEIADWVRLEVPKPLFQGGEVAGVIVHVDRFGNGISNFSGEELARHLSGDPVEVLVGDHRLEGIHSSYVDVPSGRALALIGSSGFLEISVNGGSAATELGLVPGKTAITVRARQG